MVFKVLELVVFPSLDKIVYRFFYGFLTFCFFGDNYCICNIVHLFIFSFKWSRIFCRYWPLLISGMSHGKWGCIKGMGFCILMCINYWKDHKVTWIPKGMWICNGYNAMHWTGLDTDQGFNWESSKKKGGGYNSSSIPFLNWLLLESHMFGLA